MDEASTTTTSSSLHRTTPIPFQRLGSDAGELQMWDAGQATASLVDPAAGGLARCCLTLLFALPADSASQLPLEPAMETRAAAGGAAGTPARLRFTRSHA